MRILLVEDDEFKQRRIAQVLRDFESDLLLDVARSVNSGLEAILSSPPDIVLLDMSLTTFDVGPGELGGRPQNFGGMEVLRQMDRLGVVAPVIVITQHERFAGGGGREVHLSAVHQELSEEHARVFRGLIYYNSATGKWEKELKSLIARIARGTGGDVVRKNSRRRR